MRTDLEVLNSFDHITTRASGSECVSEAEEQMLPATDRQNESEG